MNQVSRISGEQADQFGSDQETEIDNGGIRELSETEHRIRVLWEGCGTSQRFVKGVGMRAVRGSGSGSGGEEWEGIKRNGPGVSRKASRHQSSCFSLRVPCAWSSPQTLHKASPAFLELSHYLL